MKQLLSDSENSHLELRMSPGVPLAWGRHVSQNSHWSATHKRETQRDGLFYYCLVCVCTWFCSCSGSGCWCLTQSLCLLSKCSTTELHPIPIARSWNLLYHLFPRYLACPISSLKLKGQVWGSVVVNLLPITWEKEAMTTDGFISGNVLAKTREYHYEVRHSLEAKSS